MKKMKRLKKAPIKRKAKVVVHKTKVEEKPLKISTVGYTSVKDGKPKPGVTVLVIFDNGRKGNGHIKTDPNRPVWMTRYDDEPGFLFNLAWSGVNVTHWKPL